MNKKLEITINLSDLIQDAFACYDEGFDCAVSTELYKWIEENGLPSDILNHFEVNSYRDAINLREKLIVLRYGYMQQKPQPKSQKKNQKILGYRCAHCPKFFEENGLQNNILNKFQISSYRDTFNIKEK